MKRAILGLVLVLVLTSIFPPALTEAANEPLRLNVPSFRQVWEPWVNQYVGFSQMNFEMGGCAMTSLAMVLKYYGADTDPGRLNDWLKENGGIAWGASIIWSKAAEIGNGIYFDGVRNFNGSADLQYIRTQIDQGYPVIARMGYKGTDHYVVICGYSGETFYINDPWYENPGHTLDAVVEFGDTYVSYDNYTDPAAAIKGIVMFKTSGSTPAKVPVVTIASMFDDYPQVDIYGLKTPVIDMQVGNPYMYVNGVKKIVDPVGKVSPELVNDRTLVPIRAIIEEMGGNISWDGINQKVTIVLQNRTLEMWIGAKTAYINKYYFEFDVVPQIINSRTFIPLRFVTEQLGGAVSWDPAAEKIRISQK
jgi:uncharacterized protein YvpB